MGSDCFLKSGDSTWVVNTEVCTLKSVQVRQVHVYVHVHAHGHVHVHVQVLLPVVPPWRDLLPLQHVLLLQGQ